MKPFRGPATSLAVVVATTLAVRARRRNTLTRSGAAAGFVVGFLLVSTGLRGLVLVVFYQLGSWATKYRHNVKATLDASVDIQSIRGARQVFAVSLGATLLSLYHGIVYGAERPFLFRMYNAETHLSCAILAHHATSLADTWASELGMAWGAGGGVKSASPRLITQPWRRVPPGTNGGITVVGLMCSLAGGIVVAATALGLDALSGLEPFQYQPYRILTLGALCGLIGSLVDSLLGATVQITYWDPDTKRVTSKPEKKTNHQRICGNDWLTNEQVNLVSTLFTTMIGGWVLGPLLLD